MPKKKLEEEKIKIFKSYTNDLLECQVIKSALETTVCRKLKMDKCICPKYLIDGISIESANKAMGEIFKEYKLKQNTKEELLTKMDKIKDSEIDYTKSIFIIFYVLKISIIELANSGKMISLSNNSYAIVIKYLLEKSGLITEEKILESQGLLYLKNVVPKSIKSVKDYIQCITEIFEKKDNNIEYFFRGQSNLNYITVPGIYRNINYCNNESEMVRDMILKSPDYFEKYSTKFDKLSFMQHYGVPTRLLDVTANALVALYFACENNKKCTGEVEIYEVEKKFIKYPDDAETAVLSCLSFFNVEKQKEIYCSIKNYKDVPDFFYDEVEIEKNVSKDKIKEIITEKYLINPRMDNPRIIRQKGAFVLFGLVEEFDKVDGIGNFKSIPVIQK